MRGLITGICGFAGSHLAEFLLNEAGLEVAGIEIGRRTDNIKHIINKVKLFSCDIRNEPCVRKILKNFKPDFIFHLAAQSNVFDSWGSPADSLVTNVIGTLNILESVRALKLKSKIHIASSAEVYGLVYKNEVPVKETSQFRPLSPYAVGKIGQDMLGYQYSRNYNMFIVRTRAFSHIGPRMNDNFVISNFAKQIALIEKGRQDPVISVGNLEPVRDFTDVRDVVRGYWLAVNKAKSSESYNICSGKGYKIKKILELLLKLTDCKVRIKKDKLRLRPSDIVILIGDNSKFLRQTGWKAVIPLRETLSDILNYWRNKV